VSERSDSPAADLWSTLFGRPAPVEIEIGSGDGAFLLAYAARHPERSFLGIERSPSKFRRLEARLARAGLPNVRVLRADATCVVPALVPPASVATYHVYFPDPWPKRGHAFRRIFSASFVTTLARTLAAGGRLFLATDVRDYAADIRSSMLDHGAFSERADDEHPGFQTSFGRKYRAAGRPLYATTFARVDAGRRMAQPAAASKIRSM
jgi:tRNA (guanine-N7-)-methyltransferase